MSIEIAECIAHASLPEEGCEYCEKEMRQREKIYESKAQSNQSKGEKLMQMGAQLDRSSLLETRLNMLTDVIFGKDVRNRIKFETVWTEQLGEILDNALKEIGKAKLTQGINDGLRIVDKRGR